MSSLLLVGAFAAAVVAAPAAGEAELLGSGTESWTQGDDCCAAVWWTSEIPPERIATNARATTSNERTRTPRRLLFTSSPPRLDATSLRSATSQPRPRRSRHTSLPSRSIARLGPGYRPWDERPRARRAQAADQIGTQHREYQQAADHDTLDLVRDVDQRQRIADRGDDEEGEDNADEAAAATEDVDAAEEHGRDHVELEAGRVVGAAARKPGREDDPGQCRKDARDDEEHQLDAIHPHRREKRGLLIVTDGVDLAAVAAEVKHDDEDDGEHGEDDERPRDQGAGDGVEPEVGEARREAADRLLAQHDRSQAAVERERAERDDERGQCQPSHEEAVEPAADEAGEERQHQTEREGDVVQPGEA